MGWICQSCNVTVLSGASDCPKCGKSVVQRKKNHRRTQAEFICLDCYQTIIDYPDKQVECPACQRRGGAVRVRNARITLFVDGMFEGKLDQWEDNFGYLSGLSDISMIRYIRDQWAPKFGSKIRITRSTVKR
jgi:predicted RNA-binding Zn-ribbon protein involved in translation (DUF1610 family)